MEEAERAMVRARSDPAVARNLLALLTIGCRTLERFEHERAYLFRVGHPAVFLPTAQQLGRTDLAWLSNSRVATALIWSVFAGSVVRPIVSGG